LDVGCEVRVIVTNNVSWGAVFTDEEITVTARSLVATELGGGFPDELGEVAGAGGVAAGVPVLLVVPSSDSYGNIAVSLGEILTVWASSVLHFTAATVSSCGIVGKFLAPLQGWSTVVGTELVVGAETGICVTGWGVLYWLLNDRSRSIVDWLISWWCVDWLWRWLGSIGDWWFWSIGWHWSISGCWLGAGGDIDGRGDGDIVDLDDLVTVDFGNTVLSWNWDGQNRGDQSSQWEDEGTHFVMSLSFRYRDID